MFPPLPLIASMSTSAIPREPFGRSMWTSCALKVAARPPSQAVVQIHFHHHAIIKPAAEQTLLDRLGLSQSPTMRARCSGSIGSSKWLRSYPLFKFPMYLSITLDLTASAVGAQCRFHA
jgi:hypothetical protein